MKGNTAAAFTLIVGDGVASLPEMPGLATPRLSEWIAGRVDVARPGDAPKPAAIGEVVIGALLTDADAGVLTESPAGALAKAMQFPVVSIKADVAPMDLMTEALRLMAAHGEATELDAANERAALAELRQQHMEMQSAYVQVEEFAYHSLAPKFTRTQEFRNHDERVKVTAGGPVLLQRLPFSMHSMAALDVYLAAPSEGVLVLTVKRGIGPDFAAPVELELAGLTPGWIRFPFLRVLTGAPEDAFAEIAYRGPGEVELALSHPSPVEDYHLKVGGKTRPFPLALRGFRGLPGAPLPDMQMPRMEPPADGSARMVMALDLWPIKILPRVHKAVKFVGYKEYVSADFWEDENAFMVHPSTERPVVGILRNIAASALTRVSSVIHLANAEAAPVAFALGVAPAGKVKRQGQALRYLCPWTVLAPGEFGVAEQRLAQPVKGKFDLLLATSMEGQDANTKAWALFRDFSFTNGVKSA